MGCWMPIDLPQRAVASTASKPETLSTAPLIERLPAPVSTGLSGAPTAEKDDFQVQPPKKTTAQTTAPSLAPGLVRPTQLQIPTVGNLSRKRPASGSQQARGTLTKPTKPIGTALDAEKADDASAWVGTSPAPSGKPLVNYGSSSDEEQRSAEHGGKRPALDSQGSRVEQRTKTLPGVSFDTLRQSVADSPLAPTSWLAPKWSEKILKTIGLDDRRRWGVKQSRVMLRSFYASGR